ncbi:MAG: exosortase system-associated protein, TIGR04073 family [Methylococcaceae bacterium]
MTTFNRFFPSLLVAGLLSGYIPSSQAEDAQKPLSYGEKVEAKAAGAFTNLTGSVLEIPKNIINTTNDSNIFYGLVGGTIKGAINTAGRIGVGIADLVTIPLPTKPIADPDPVWEDFDADTTYGDVFRLDENKPAPPAAPLPVAQTVAPAPIAAPAPVDRSSLYNERTNQSLDRVFKKEMMK